MKNTIELVCPTGKKILILPVPEYADSFRMIPVVGRRFCWTETIEGKFLPKYIELKDDCQLLGSCTVTNGQLQCDFDCSELVESYEIPIDENDCKVGFVNYGERKSLGESNTFSNPNVSFFSWLLTQQSDSFRLVNRYGEEPKLIDPVAAMIPSIVERHQKQHDQWQYEEAQLVKKFVVIQTI